MKTTTGRGLGWASAAMLAKRRLACATRRLLPLLLLLTLPAVVQAQFDYMDNDDGTCTITGYSGSGGAVTIPGTTNDLVVTCISNWAFKYCPSLTGVTIPNSVINIGDFAFINCTNLTSVTIGKGVANIGDNVFLNCTSLCDVYFKGIAPRLGRDVFNRDDKVTVYYLSGTTGWSKTFGGRPTAPWNPQVRSNATSGVRSN